jgi:hypothetical protein
MGPKFAGPSASASDILHDTLDVAVRPQAWGCLEQVEEVPSNGDRDEEHQIEG